MIVAVIGGGKMESTRFLANISNDSRISITEIGDSSKIHSIK